MTTPDPQFMTASECARLQDGPTLGETWAKVRGSSVGPMCADNFYQHIDDLKDGDFRIIAYRLFSEYEKMLNKSNDTVFDLQCRINVLIATHQDGERLHKARGSMGLDNHLKSIMKKA